MEAISLIKIYKKINNSELLIEIDNWKISSKNSNSQFLNLLGKNCKYLFEKLCIKNKIQIEFFNIFNLNGNKFIFNSFNDVYNLGIFNNNNFIKILKEIKTQQFNY